MQVNVVHLSSMVRGRVCVCVYFLFILMLQSNLDVSSFHSELIFELIRKTETVNLSLS